MVSILPVYISQVLIQLFKLVKVCNVFDLSGVRWYMLRSIAPLDASR
jgi:hypothetical protein